MIDKTMIAEHLEFYIHQRAEYYYEHDCGVYLECLEMARNYYVALLQE